jgi:hypothetical protein
MNARDIFSVGEPIVVGGRWTGTIIGFEGLECDVVVRWTTPRSDLGDETIICSAHVDVRGGASSYRRLPPSRGDFPRRHA